MFGSKKSKKGDSVSKSSSTKKAKSKSETSIDGIDSGHHVYPTAGVDPVNVGLSSSQPSGYIYSNDSSSSRNPTAATPVDSDRQPNLAKGSERRSNASVSAGQQQPQQQPIVTVDSRPPSSSRSSQSSKQRRHRDTVDSGFCSKDESYHDVTSSAHNLHTSTTGSFRTDGCEVQQVSNFERSSVRASMKKAYGVYEHLPGQSAAMPSSQQGTRHHAKSLSVPYSTDTSAGQKKNSMAKSDEHLATTNSMRGGDDISGTVVIQPMSSDLSPKKHKKSSKKDSSVDKSKKSKKNSENIELQTEDKNAASITAVTAAIDYERRLSVTNNKTDEPVKTGKLKRSASDHQKSKTKHKEKQSAAEMDPQPLSSSHSATQLSSKNVQSPQMSFSGMPSTPAKHQMSPSMSFSMYRRPSSISDSYNFISVDELYSKTSGDMTTSSADLDFDDNPKKSTELSNAIIQLPGSPTRKYNSSGWEKRKPTDRRESLNSPNVSPGKTAAKEGRQLHSSQGNASGEDNGSSFQQSSHSPGPRHQADVTPPPLPPRYYQENDDVLSNLLSTQLNGQHQQHQQQQFANNNRVDMASYRQDFNVDRNNRNNYLNDSDISNKTSLLSDADSAKTDKYADQLRKESSRRYSESVKVTRRPRISSSMLAPSTTSLSEPNMTIKRSLGINNDAATERDYDVDSPVFASAVVKPEINEAQSARNNVNGPTFDTGFEVESMRHVAAGRPTQLSYSTNYSSDNRSGPAADAWYGSQSVQASGKYSDNIPSPTPLLGNQGKPQTLNGFTVFAYGKNNVSYIPVDDANYTIQHDIHTHVTSDSYDAYKQQQLLAREFATDRLDSNLYKSSSPSNVLSESNMRTQRDNSYEKRVEKQPSYSQHSASQYDNKETAKYMDTVYKDYTYRAYTVDSAKPHVMQSNSDLNSNNMQHPSNNNMQHVTNSYFQQQYQHQQPLSYRQNSPLTDKQRAPSFQVYQSARPNPTYNTADQLKFPQTFTTVEALKYDPSASIDDKFNDSEASRNNDTSLQAISLPQSTIISGSSSPIVGVTSLTQSSESISSSSSTYRSTLSLQLTPTSQTNSEDQFRQASPQENATNNFRKASPQESVTNNYRKASPQESVTNNFRKVNPQENITKRPPTLSKYLPPWTSNSTKRGLPAATVLGVRRDLMNSDYKSSSSEENAKLNMSSNLLMDQKLSPMSNSYSARSVDNLSDRKSKFSAMDEPSYFLSERPQMMPNWQKQSSSDVIVPSDSKILMVEPLNEKLLPTEQIIPVPSSSQANASLVSNKDVLKQNNYFIRTSDESSPVPSQNKITALEEEIWPLAPESNKNSSSLTTEDNNRGSLTPENNKNIGSNFSVDNPLSPLNNLSLARSVSEDAITNAADKRSMFKTKSKTTDETKQVRFDSQSAPSTASASFRDNLYAVPITVEKNKLFPMVSNSVSAKNSVPVITAVCMPTDDIEKCDSFASSSKLPAPGLSPIESSNSLSLAGYISTAKIVEEIVHVEAKVISVMPHKNNSNKAENAKALELDDVIDSSFKKTTNLTNRNINTTSSIINSSSTSNDAANLKALDNNFISNEETIEKGKSLQTDEALDNTVRSCDKEVMLKYVNRRLDQLSEQRLNVQREIEANDKLGLQMEDIVQAKLSSKEADKCRSFLNDLKMVARLLVNLSSRLSQLKSLANKSSDDKKRGEELQEKYSEAELLKTSIDQRGVRLVDVIHNNFTNEESTLFERYISKLPTLLLTQADLEEKLRTGKLEQDALLKEINENESKLL